MTPAEIEAAAPGDEQAAQMMRQIKVEYSGDDESIHYWADDLLCDILLALGYKETVTVFKEIEKWYA
jgi:hypothetical protein